MSMTANADDAIELLVRKRLPPGGEAVLVRGDDGALLRGILYRTDAPFPPLVRKLNPPIGGTLKLRVQCSGDGYVLVTWGNVKRPARALRKGPSRP